MRPDQRLNRNLVSPLRIFPVTDTGQPDLRRVRDSLGMEQEEISDFLGVGVGTYRSWEGHHRTPSAAALSLLKILVARPDVVRDVLGSTTGIEKMS